ncbi:MAG: family 16 glycosylhydrolase [Granulosicoccus sp.]
MSGISQLNVDQVPPLIASLGYHRLMLNPSLHEYQALDAGRKLTMAPVFKLTLIACLAAGIGACSSGSSESGDTPGTSVPADDQSAEPDGNSPDNMTGNESENQADANGSEQNDTTAPLIPELDPTAEPIPAPNPDDPFGSLLEVDNETPVAGAGPTQPKNLRIDLVSNDWAEFSWAPANDDGNVVEYRIKRSDGHVYTMREDLSSTNGGTQAELDKQWTTTSFIDCNYTRFSDSIHNCNEFGPEPGDIFSYEVTAVDNEGNESAPSDPITITYHQQQNAPVPLYKDRFLDDSGFAQNHDLSSPANFLDKFTLVFEDDFNGDTIDEARWNTQLVWGDQEVINNEQQYFVNTQRTPDFGYDPFKLENSILTIEAIPTPEGLKDQLPPKCSLINEAKPPCLFLSGALATQNKFNMTFGFVEARMKTSDISGALSSFYLYHRYPGEGVERNAPEIDIVEYLGENPFGDEDAFQTYHFDDVTTGITRSSPTMNFENPDGSLYSDDFHTYSVLWEPQLVIWYIDGEEIKRLSGPQVGARAMNIVTYLVAGSGWAPTPDMNGPFPLKLEIDYIRAYQRDAYKTNGLYP